MKHISILPALMALATGICLCTACSNKAKDRANSLETIPLGDAFEQQTELKASDCFKQVRYVALETNDSCLVGDNPQIEITSDRIIVMTAHRQCMAFDKQTGKYLYSIGHVGDDPEACREMYGWLNEAAGHLYFPGANYREMAVYDLNNRFIRRQKEVIDPPKGSISPQEYDYLDEKTLLVHAYATTETPDLVALVRDTTIMTTYPTHSEAGGEHVPRLGMDTSTFSIETEGTAGHTLYILLDEEKCVSVTTMEHGPFWHLGKETFLKVNFNDTIYRVTADGLKPHRLLDAGKKRWDFNDRYYANKDSGLFPLCFMENERTILFRFCQYLYHPEDRKAYNAVYDKESKRVKVAPYDAGLMDDLTRFMPLQPTVSTASGEMAQLLQPLDILSWFEEHPDASDLPADVEALRQLKEDDNPVIAVMQ